MLNNIDKLTNYIKHYASMSVVSSVLPGFVADPCWQSDLKVLDSFVSGESDVRIL